MYLGDGVSDSCRFFLCFIGNVFKKFAAKETALSIRICKQTFYSFFRINFLKMPHILYV